MSTKMSTKTETNDVYKKPYKSYKTIQTTSNSTFVTSKNIKFTKSSKTLKSAEKTSKSKISKPLDTGKNANSFNIAKASKKTSKAAKISKKDLCASAKACKNPEGLEIDWVFCETCEKWYHCQCVNIDSQLANDESYVFICKPCKPVEAESKAIENAISNGSEFGLVFKSEQFNKPNPNEIKMSEISEKLGKPENVETLHMIGIPEKVERPQTIEKPYKVEKADKVEKPYKVEKADKVVKPYKIENPDKGTNWLLKPFVQPDMARKPYMIKMSEKPKSNTEKPEKPYKFKKPETPYKFKKPEKPHNLKKSLLCAGGLKACTNPDEGSKINWVLCDLCKKWYHIQCISEDRGCKPCKPQNPEEPENLKKVKKSLLCASGPKGCLNPEGLEIVWVFCETCEKWYHCQCVNVDTEKASDEKFEFQCKGCELGTNNKVKFDIEIFKDDFLSFFPICECKIFFFSILLFEIYYLF